METTTVKTLSVWDHKDAGRLASQIAYHLLYPTPTNPDVTQARVLRVDLDYREGEFPNKPAGSELWKRFLVVDIFEAVPTPQCWRLYKSYNCLNPSCGERPNNTLIVPIIKGADFQEFMALVAPSLIGQVLSSGRMEFCDQGHSGSTQHKLTFFITGTEEKLTTGSWVPEERVPRFLAFKKSRSLKAVLSDGERLNLGQRFGEEDLVRLFVIWQIDPKLLSGIFAEWATRKLQWLTDKVEQFSPICQSPGGGCTM